MKKIGKLLREARTEKNINLDDICRKTKIQKKYLQALEKGEISIFSGEVYIRGVLRNYAQTIGLNADEILSLYNRFRTDHSPEKKEQQPTKKEQAIFFTRKERKPLPGVAITWMIIIAFVFIGSIWYLHGQNDQKNKKAPYTEGYFQENNEEQTGPTAPGTVPFEQLPVEKELIMIAENGNEVTYALSGVEQAEITLDFPGRCWVRVLQDGSQVEEKIFNAGESKCLGDARETLLHFGNPPAARLTVNGLEINNLVRFKNPVKIIIKKE